jgi:hypothetical protein
MPSPIGDVIVIVPAAVAQVGCVTVAEGDAGVNGWASTVFVVPSEIHPSAFFAVMVYVPGATALNVVPDW